MREVDEHGSSDAARDLDRFRHGDDTTAAGALDTIPVTPTGWTDLAEIRLLGQRWLRQR